MCQLESHWCEKAIALDYQWKMRLLGNVAAVYIANRSVFKRSFAAVRVVILRTAQFDLIIYWTCIESSPHIFCHNLSASCQKYLYSTLKITLESTITYSLMSCTQKIDILLRTVLIIDGEIQLDIKTSEAW